MTMLCFGESLNVMMTKIKRAFKERDPGPIQEEAKRQVEKGMDYIDINLGPAKKDGVELMPWVVETVQEACDLPLLLDTSNIDAIEAGLKVCKQPPIINSIMCRPERYEKMIPMAAEYNADFVALMWGPEGLPRDENERAMLWVELMSVANEAGIPNEKIWVDGIVTPVNVQQDQAMKLISFYEMLPDMSPGVRSTCGLSNVSNGAPEHLRPILNQTYAVMLEKYGMQSIITDPLDETMTAIAKGERPDIVEVVYKTMDEDEPDLNSLSNVSNGAPEHLRPILNQTYAVMLEKYGMQSIITDPLDETMTAIAKGERPDIVEVVYKTMDEDEPDLNSLSKELGDYVKTTRVIMGKSLYSDSWLEL